MPALVLGAGDHQPLGVFLADVQALAVDVEHRQARLGVGTDAQYTALAGLTRLLRAAFPGITPERIQGHCDIAPERKTDPGEAFDWSRYRAGLTDSKEET